MQPLSFLLENLSETNCAVAPIVISHITNNSKDVRENALFIAYPGERTDGRKYIADAIAKGAAAIAYEPSDDFILPKTTLPCIPIKNLKTKQSKIAARFYDFPSVKIPVVGVTGTNGKTSVTHFIAQSLKQCAVIGTMGYGFLSQLKKTINTTPDGLQLQTLFAECINQGAQGIAMEVSSHALSQQRVNDVLFHTTVFTNLTQDHLDYHQTMKNYRDAKELLFQQSNVKNAVINIDDAAGEYFAQKYKNKLNVITYARQKEADIAVLDCKTEQHGFQLTVKTPWGTGEYQVPFIGEFNIDNILATIGVLGLLSMPLQMIIEKIAVLKTVNGRMQLFHAKNKPTVIVDYAHTPDALQKALDSVHAHCQGNIICVFGCGGERDKTKRPAMGAIAERVARHIILTNDNPRGESPKKIAQDILSGVRNQNKFIVELDREKAIQKAIESAGKDDWILIAGKGHETEQIIGDQALHHSDVECVLRYQ